MIARLSRRVKNTHEPRARRVFLAFRMSSKIPSVWITLYPAQQTIWYLFYQIKTGKAGKCPFWYLFYRIIKPSPTLTPTPTL